MTIGPLGQGLEELRALGIQERRLPAAVHDAPPPARGEWRFGRRMALPGVRLPFPLTREGFEASLPQVRLGEGGCMRRWKAHAGAL